MGIKACDHSKPLEDIVQPSGVRSSVIVDPFSFLLHSCTALGECFPTCMFHLPFSTWPVMAAIVENPRMKKNPFPFCSLKKLIPESIWEYGNTCFLYLYTLGSILAFSASSFLM